LVIDKNYTEMRGQRNKIILGSYQNIRGEIFPITSFIMEIRSYRSKLSVSESEPTFLRVFTKHSWPTKIHRITSMMISLTDYVSIRTGIRRATDEEL